MKLAQNNFKKSILSIALTLWMGATMANTTTVASVAALQSAINSASVGDTVVLANGTYQNNTLTISIKRIHVQAATPGGVYLNGTNAITITADSVTFSGFQFTSGTITGNAIAVKGNYNTLTQLNFNGYSAAHMIVLSGRSNLLAYSNFQNKPALNMVTQGGTGDMVQIIPNDTMAGYNTIRYCSFQHMPGVGGDYGNECIRIGDGKYSTFVSRTVVEYCFFEDTGNGDSEAISVKSRENCLRYNTMLDNPDAMFSFRNGDSNLAYGNFFIRSGGIRCKQANNIYCYNNYFQTSGTTKSSSPPVYFEYYGTGYGSNFNCIHNTFYKCAAAVIDTALTACTWANNIFYSDSTTIFSGTTSGQTFAGNIYQGTLGLSITSGMNDLNPLLTLNAAGYYGLSATSPAIAASSAGYPAVINLTGLNNDPDILLDIAGKSRPSSATLKDVGCEQYAGTSGSIHPLALTDVGPSYLDTTNTAVSLATSDAGKAIVYPNPGKGEFYIQTTSPISKIEVVNMWGEKCYTAPVNPQTTLNAINLSALTTGVYFIKITDLHGKVANKEIILK
ncbi:MAG: chondroitinase-B domain-containing protein [Paludibacteraceae bacterium]|nr:chondroitinase-B domain-containing protein [Paludibacteraceae bacterium]